MGNTDLFGQAPLQDGGAGTYIGFAGPRIYARGAAAYGNPMAVNINTTLPASGYTGGANAAGVSPNSVGSAPVNFAAGYNRIVTRRFLNMG